MVRNVYLLRTRIGFAFIFVLCTACLRAEPPQFQILQLVGDEAAAAPVAAAPAGVGAGRAQAYYYSHGKKISLAATGIAVASIKQGIAIDTLGLDMQRASAAPVGPLAELAPALRARGLVFVRSEGPNSLSLSGDLPGEVSKEVNHILPVVYPDPKAVDANPNAVPTFLVMTPRIVAAFNTRTTRRDVEGYLDGLNLKIVADPEFGPDRDGYQLELASGPVTYSRILTAANKLYEKGKAGGYLQFAHPDFIPTKNRQSDPLLDDQWHLKNSGTSAGVVGADVKAHEAWAITMGKPEVFIAIIDDSVEKSHPDLSQNYKAGRYFDGVTGTHSNDPSPKDGSQRHGTSCAGVALGSANTVGGRGAAPKCSLIGVNIWDGSVSQIPKAFYFAESAGASVISCSWSWGAAFDSTSNAIRWVATQGRSGKGVLVLFAAGNDYGSVQANQAFGALAEVMIIGASNWRDDHSKYSNYGRAVSVCAPSSDFYDVAGSLSICTTDNTDSSPHPGNSNFSGYVVGDYTPVVGPAGFGGTSSATPLVAGVAGLVLSLKPDLTATQVRSIIESTADKVPGVTVPAAYDSSGHDINYGFGRVNAKKALDKAATFP